LRFFRNPALPDLAGNDVQVGRAAAVTAQQRRVSPVVVEGESVGDAAGAVIRILAGDLVDPRESGASAF
jgi:hypothetical protein